jgi:hypothetical protein
MPIGSRAVLGLPVVGAVIGLALVGAATQVKPSRAVDLFQVGWVQRK